MASDNDVREERLVQRILQPFRAFAQIEASGGILLLGATAVALLWANSPLAHSYFALWETSLGVHFGDAALSKSSLHWINDGLMAIFFFVVGLEIKRELLVGELASLRKAALPVVAALGGMAVPAAIYLSFNFGTPAAAGWGIPVATDIAFALGVLALLGPRAPLALKVFLAALAIIDDIGAVVVIALFYTAQIHWLSLLIAALLLCALVGANRIGVRSPLVYSLLGIGLWLAFLESGVHATISGVILAMTIPAWRKIDGAAFPDRMRAIMDMHETSGDEATLSKDQQRQAALQELETLIDDAQAPLQRFEHALHPWVAYLIVPLFALANAGVSLAGNGAGGITHPVSLGVAAGLVFGKPIGITTATWLAARTGLVSLPSGLNWRHILGAGWLGGIGFTMSLFIAGLAFGDSTLLSLGKLGILGGSLISGLTGFFILRRAARAKAT